MDDAKRADARRASKSARLVWLLVLLGLGTGAFTLWIVRAALREIAAQRTQLLATQDAVDELESKASDGFDRERGRVQQLLAGQANTRRSADPIAEMRGAVERFRRSTAGGPAAAAAVTDELDAFLGRLALLDSACTSWNQRYAQSARDVAEKKKEVDAAVVRMRAALSTAEGRQGLQLAARVRRFRQSTGRAAQDEAAQIIGRLGTSVEVSEIPVEVSNLALLCQQLIGEEEVDRLADLKDNLFLASLLRLDRTVALSGTTDPALTREMTAALAAFEQAAFGAGCAIDGEHQTIIADPDGLYAACHRRLELRQQREALRADAAARADDYTRAYQHLDAFCDAFKDGITLKAQAALAGPWRHLLAVSLACGASLIVLGKIIATTIRRQITAVTEATADLRRSNAQMAAVHRTSLDCVLVLDAQWRIINFNPAAERAFQCPQRDAVGRLLPEFVVPPKGGRPGEFATGGGADSVLGKLVEVVARRPDGSTFPAEMAVTAAVMDGPPLYIASLRDLTDRKKAEAERAELTDRLMKASRHAGMAEVATGVLHNVGNVLNSVNVTAATMADRVRQSRVPHLVRAAQLLGEHEHDLAAFVTADERGRQLPGFLVQLAGHLSEESAHLDQELRSLAQNVEHIKEIVATQQSYGRAGGVVEEVSLVDLVEDALRINMAGLERHDVELVRDFAAAPVVRTDKHQVLQILVNLISNAKYAMEGRGDKRMTLGVAAVGEDRIAVSVTDTGVGIPPENLTRIFSHGFTTRKDGHGFGLHSSANAARSIGGSLAVHSDGPGRGARFTLELPRAAAPLPAKEAQPCPA